MTFYIEKYDIRGDGSILIFKRPTRNKTTTDNWHMRIRLPISTGYFRGSTKESNRSNAERTALNKFDELYARVKGGGNITNFSFARLYEEWSNYWIQTSTQKLEKYKRDKVKLIENFPLKFFTEVMKDVDVNEIKDIDILEYKMWRKKNSYNTSGKKFTPSASTINSEISALNLMFDYGTAKGYITKKPNLKREPLPDNRRPTFTKVEYSDLVKHMRERVKTSPANVSRDRFYLQNYILILANTGIRVGEARTCCWQDIRTQDYEGEKRLILSIDGKTGRRDVASNKGTETYFKRIYDYRTKELNGAVDKRENVFCHLDGKPIMSFKRSFDSLLSSIDLTNDSRGKKRTIYSLRHFFATMRLEEEVSPYLLAQNMGTSLEMLRKFYGQIITERVALELTKTKSNISVKKSDKNYPFD